VSEIRGLVVAIGVAVSGVVALIVGQYDIALNCIIAETALLAPSPLGK
jgi:hypothetical protein